MGENPQVSNPLTNRETYVRTYVLALILIFFECSSTKRGREDKKLIKAGVKA